MQSVPRSKHTVSVIQTSQLMLYREIMAVCSEIHTEHINTLCGQNVEFLSVKPGGIYEAYQESKDTSRVGRQGNFLCLLWQHCRRPWSFTCEPCSFDSGRTGFVWVRRVWNGSADPKSRQMLGAFRHTISQHKMWSGIYWTIRRTVRTSRPAISTCFFT